MSCDFVTDSLDKFRVIQYFLVVLNFSLDMIKLMWIWTFIINEKNLIFDEYFTILNIVRIEQSFNETKNSIGLKEKLKSWWKYKIIIKAFNLNRVTFTKKIKLTSKATKNDMYLEADTTMIEFEWTQ